MLTQNYSKFRLIAIFPSKFTKHGVLTSSITNEIMQLYTDREFLTWGFVVVIKVLHAIVAQSLPNNARRVTAFAVLRKLVFCMWPEESSYFNRGVVEGILTKTTMRD